MLNRYDTSDIAPCNHEEADVPIFLHLADGICGGSKMALIRTTDTDVVVIAVAVAAKLKNEQLWIWFGTGKTQRFIPAHEIAKKL